MNAGRDRDSTHPTWPAGRTAHDSGSVPHLGAGNLAWSELADAVWLTAATQYAWGRQRGAKSGDEQASAATPHEDEGAANAAEPAPAPADQPPSGPPSDPPSDEASPEPEADRSAEQDVPQDDGNVEAETILSVGPSAAGVSAARTDHPARTKVRSLAAGLDIIRALRPFKRQVPSPHANDELLDEEATAERAVEDGLWLPVTRPNTSRWLDLTLVVDTSPSMALWRSTIDAVVTSMERLGAFRSIQRRLLDTRRTPLLRGGSTDAHPRSPAELLDGSGRRIVLVITDGVGACWRQGRISPLLAQWGESMSVAVAHLLPQRLWRRGGLRPHRAKLTTPRPMAPNRRWSVDLPDAWLDPAPVPDDAVPVPILELDTRWLGRWAQLVAGNRTRSVDATVMLADEHPPHEDDSTAGGQDSARSPRQRVMSFVSTASPPAFRLATLLAAVPVTVPVARRIQAELVPESEPAHVAEVFTSGLLRPVDDTETEGWETASFDFEQPVRELLLSGARRSETAHAVRVVGDDFSGSLAGASRLRDVLAAPDAMPIPASSPDTAASVSLERTVLRALSGPYLRRAEELSRVINHNEDAQATTALGQDQPAQGSADAAGLPKEDQAVQSNMERSRIPTVSETMAKQTESSKNPQSHLPGDQALPVVPPEPGDTASGGEDSANPSPAVTARILRGRQAADVPPIWGDIPPRNPIFTGREESLERLHSGLSTDGAAAILPAALHGMGGIGKTQIAVEYIYRHLQDYDLVWWIQSGQPSQIRAGFTDLAQALRLPGGGEANTAVPAVREALRRGNPVRRWLLVFDAAESPESVRPFFPSNGPGDIIITSRNPDWAEVADPLEITLFERAESKRLLRSRGPEITDEEADGLAEKLGDLPLAIAQAASWRAETGMPVSEYLRVFDEKVAEILDASTPNDYEVSLAAAWTVSFDQLESRNPAAHQLLQVCAFFSPEPICRSLFMGVRGTAISPELDAALRDPIRLGRAIRDINRYGLAKIDHRNDTLQLHRLVQLVLHDRMMPQRRAEMRHGAHVLLATLNPNDPSKPEQWPRYHAILPHAYASDVLNCDDPWVRQLTIDLMDYLYHWGDHGESATLAERAIETWSETLDENDPQLLRVAGKLGFYLWTLGRYSEAAELNRQTLAQRRETAGDNSEETLAAEMRVAFDLKAKGQFLEARDMNQQTYDKSKGLYGEDDPVTLAAAHDLAVSHRLIGDYRRARELDEDNYQRRVEVRGFDSTPATNTLSGLIRDRLEMGDYTWAHAEQERLTDRSRQLFGENKAITLQRQHQLSIAARKNGEHQEAMTLSGQALEQFRYRYGADHPNTVACAVSHSLDLRQTGSLADARTLGEDSFDRYRRSLGENHPHTLAAAVNLSVALRLLGEVAGARQLDERSAEQLRATFGPDQHHVLVATTNLASDLAALGEVESALSLGTEVARRADRVLGADHPLTVAAHHNVVLDLRATGSNEQAEPKHADVLARFRRVLGDAHPGVLAAARGLRANCDIDPQPL